MSENRERREIKTYGGKERRDFGRFGRGDDYIYRPSQNPDSAYDCADDYGKGYEAEHKEINRGDVFLASFLTEATAATVGKRPYVVVSSDVGNHNGCLSVVVVPLTSRIGKAYPMHLDLPKRFYPFLAKDSVVKCEQITTISKSDLLQYLGTLDKQTMTGLNRCICFAIGLY